MKNAKYECIPELAPYVKKTRYETPKENFKQILAKVESMVDVDRDLSLVDIGCSNGEFLYYIKTKHPNWKLTGFDPAKVYIETGKDFPGLSGVRLEVGELKDACGAYDAVVCVGTFQIFREFEDGLEKLLSLCKDGGVVAVSALFNKYDVDSKIVFRDNSKPESEGLWRADYNQYSQKTLRNFLKGKVKSVEFHEVVMIDLPFDPDNPHMNEFTFRDTNGKNIITNGLNMIVTPTIMVIRK